MRMTFNQIAKSMKFDEETHKLTINDKEIGFVYYRSGYQVEQYTCQEDWDARTKLELS